MVGALDELVVLGNDAEAVVQWAGDEAKWLQSDVGSLPTGPFLEYFNSIIALLQVVQEGGEMTDALTSLLDLRPKLATYAVGLVPALPPATIAPAPTPAFADIKLTGKGSKVVKFTKPDAPAIVKVTEKGSSNFIVESLDSHGDTNDLLVNEIGNYSGTLLLDGDTGEQSVAFKIESNGSWTLIVKPLLSARVWDPSIALSGKGDDVALVFPSPDEFTIVTLKHGGESNFAIWAYGSDSTDLLVNEIGKYSGETTISSGLLLLEITADGAWSITPQ